MHILHSPGTFGFRTNRTGAPHGDVLSRINPRLNNLSIYLVCSSSCTTDNGYAFRFEGGSVPVLISWSTALFGGNPSGNSSLKTSLNSCNTVCTSTSLELPIGASACS